MEIELFRINPAQWDPFHQQKMEQKEPNIHYLRPLVRYFLNSRTIIMKLRTVKDKQTLFLPTKIGIGVGFKLSLS